jgi:ABC-type multidrug transport system ATPase subunit
LLAIHELTGPGLQVSELTIDDGECVAILGPSGAGKSLLLRAIADLDPNRGRITAAAIEREQVAATEWRRKVCYVPAESGWWSATVAEHFSDVSRATALLASTGLANDAMNWPVTRLSTGEKQRLALIRALILDPPVLLLDEPTSALYEDTTQQIEQLLQSRLQQGVSILLVTHDKRQAERLASRIVHISRGQLLAEIN